MNRFYFIACLCIYIYEYVLTLQEVNTLVNAYGVSVWIRMSAISFFVATLPCFISHFHQQKGNWQTLLVFMFPRERVFPILRTASQFLCQNFARRAKQQSRWLRRLTEKSTRIAFFFSGALFNKQKNSLNQCFDSSGPLSLPFVHFLFLNSIITNTTYVSIRKISNFQRPSLISPFLVPALIKIV